MTILNSGSNFLKVLVNGGGFVKDLETLGALGVYAPLEGGHEGRFQRRMRVKGYQSLTVTARGLGDLESFLTGVHGVRPSHLGKKDIRTYFIPPIVNYQMENLPPKSKGLVLWIIEGVVFSSQEIEYLVSLAKQMPKLKIVVEMGGDREFSWKPLGEVLKAA
jgi:NAD(P)H-quinone oxidoreductase subunit N